VPIAVLPPSKQVILNPKPDPRVSAGFVQTSGPVPAIRILLHPGQEDIKDVVVVVRRTTYADLSGQISRVTGTLKSGVIEFHPNFPGDVRSLDLQVLRTVPASIVRDLTVPDLSLSTGGQWIYLTLEKPFSANIAGLGTVVATAQKLGSTMRHQASFHLGFVPTAADPFSRQTVSFEWLSPKPEDLGLDGIILPGHRPPLQAPSETVRRKPLKVGKIGPVKIRVTTSYLRSVPWFETVIPVAGS
jgi:hypothetical protein